MEQLKEKRSDIYEVDVRKIKSLNRAGGNIRTDYGIIDGSLEELSKSIEENGIKVPIRAFRCPDNEGEWIAIDGHRRLSASMKLVEEKGLTIKAKIISVDKRTITDEQLIIDMFVTNSGKPLNPVEEAEGVRRLHAYGFSTKEIALKLSKKEVLIKNLLLLANAPRRLRELISKNVLSYTLVLNLLRESGDYNSVVEKIEKALVDSKKEKTARNERLGLEEGFDVDDDTYAKVTKRHIDSSSNKVDSFKELCLAFKTKNHSSPDITVKNVELYAFAKNIVNNKLTLSEIKQLLFN